MAENVNKLYNQQSASQLNSELTKPISFLNLPQLKEALKKAQIYRSCNS